MAVADIAPDNRVTQPLTLTLSRKGRGDGYSGRLRFANRPYMLTGTLRGNGQ